MPSIDQWIAMSAVGATLLAAVIGGIMARTRRRRQADPNPMAVGAQATLATGDIHFNFHAPPAPEPTPASGERRHIVVEPQPTSLPQAGPRQIEQVEQPSGAEAQEELVLVDSWPACDAGPWDVEPGGDTKVELDVDSGHRVEGHLDGDADFEYEIVNALNYARLRRGERYSAVKEGAGESVYIVKWKVRGRGPWFLLMRAYGKRNIREVEVNLTATQE